MANTNTNAYTFGYAVVMTLIVAISLAGVSTGLKPIQEKAEALDKKKNILMAVIDVDEIAKLEADKNLAEGWYGNRIKPVVVDEKGNEVQGEDAFEIEIKKEFKKASGQKMPLYVYEHSGKKRYIMPLHGAGLWDEIWGFVALDQDLKTIVGTSYDHKGETPGLGAEITQSWFEDQFKGKKFTKVSDNNYIEVMKGKGNPNKKDYQVDGISGATITGDGVDAMLEKGYKYYGAYFQKIKN